MDSAEAGTKSDDFRGSTQERSETPRRGPGRPPGSGKTPEKKAEVPFSGIKKIPGLDEWHDYIGNFALKWTCRGYIAFAFRGLDQEILSDAEKAAIQPSPEMLSDVSKPLAHIADRSKFGKTYGRVIMDSSDGIAAFIQLAMWGNRVNRIANLHRKALTNVISDGSSGEGVSGETPSEPGQNGSNVLDFGRTNPASGFGYN